MKKQNKVRNIIISLVLVIAIVIGIFFTINKQISAKAKVYPLADLAYEGMVWENQESMPAELFSSGVQDVYISDTQEIKEILVKEGQEVKKGDLLLAYDSTLTDLSLKRLESQINRAEYDLEKAKEHHAKVSKYYPGMPIPDSDFSGGYSAGYYSDIGTVFSDYEDNSDEPNTTPSTASSTIPSSEPLASESQASNQTPSSSENPTARDNSTVSDNPTTSENPTASESTVTGTDPTASAKPTTNPTDEPSTSTSPPTSSPDNSQPTKPQKAPSNFPYSGNGKLNDPFNISLEKNLKLDENLFEDLFAEAEKQAAAASQGQPISLKEVYMLLSSPENNGFLVKVSRSTEPDFALEIIIPEVEVEEPGGQIIDFPPIYEPIPLTTMTITEVKQAQAEAAEDLRNKEIALRELTYSLKEQKEEFNNKQVLANMDGVVSLPNDLETAKAEKLPFIKVSGSSSYLIRSRVSEYKLDEYPAGREVLVMDYETGMTHSAVVKEIDLTRTDNSYYSSSSPQVSYYPMFLEVDASADLKPYSYFELLTEEAQVMDMNYILPPMFVQQHEGKNYILIDQDGELVRHEVRVIRRNDYEVEVAREDIDMDMLIAFPPSKYALPGKMTVPADVQEVFGGYY